MGAHEASRLLETDRTADRLGATLPLLDEDQVVAVVGWPEAVDLALIERLDVAAVALRVEGADPAPALRRRASERGVRIVDPWSPVLTDVPRFLVAAAAIGPEQCLVPAGTADALDTLGTAVREVWVVGGVGRVLPGSRSTTSCAGRRSRRPTISPTTRSPVEELVDRPRRLHRRSARRAARDRSRGALRLPGRAGAPPPARLTGRRRSRRR